MSFSLPQCVNRAGPEMLECVVVRLSVYPQSLPYCKCLSMRQCVDLQDLVRGVISVDTAVVNANTEEYCMCG